MHLQGLISLATSRRVVTGDAVGALCVCCGGWLATSPLLCGEFRLEQVCRVPFAAGVWMEANAGEGQKRTKLMLHPSAR